MDMKASPTLSSEIWARIELSESYLVCLMYEEAASLASSILKELCKKTSDMPEFMESLSDVEFHDMLESTAMVLLQSLHQLHRASEILNELKQSFPSVAAIPVQVLLTGVCFQIPENSSGVQEFLEEFLSKWRLANERYYILAGTEANIDNVEVCDERFVLGVDKYLDVVEVYVMKLLLTTPHDVNLAITWVEKAELPEEKRQGLLRRLHSLHSVKATNSSRGYSLPLSVENHKIHSSNIEKLNISDGSPEVLDNGNYPLNREKSRKQTVLRLSKRVEPCFWWIRAINLKFGNAQVVISNRKIALGFMILLAYWILRRKRASLKGFLGWRWTQRVQVQVQIQVQTHQHLNPIRRFGVVVEMETHSANKDYVRYNHSDPCRFSRWTARESYQFMYGRPWQQVLDFYSNLVNGTTSFSSLFPLHKYQVDDDDYDAEIPEISDDKVKLKKSEERSGRWARVTFKVVLGYNGASFDGWQKQPGLNTVQGLVERSLGRFVDEKKAQLLKDKCLPLEACAAVAGRTDKGVTALQQVCSFYTWRKDITCQDIEEAINNAAPGKLKAKSVSEVSRVFHPNFSAKWRRYLYIFPFNDEEDEEQSNKNGENLETYEKIESGCGEWNDESFGNLIIDDSEELESGKKPSSFSVSRVDQLLRLLEGKLLSYKMFARDTKASRNEGPPTECFIYHARAAEARLPTSDCTEGRRIMHVELVANRFLRKMVRVLVATSIREAAAGAEEDALLKLMDATCRSATAPPAPPDGLCLVDVGYSEFKPNNCLISKE